MQSIDQPDKKHPVCHDCHVDDTSLHRSPPRRCSDAQILFCACRQRQAWAGGSWAVAMVRAVGYWMAFS
eukprot:6046678-Alexandrium_andersonii.AAC.1